MRNCVIVVCHCHCEEQKWIPRWRLSVGARVPRGMESDITSPRSRGSDSGRLFFFLCSLFTSSTKRPTRTPYVLLLVFLSCCASLQLLQPSTPPSLPQKTRGHRVSGRRRATSAYLRVTDACFDVLDHYPFKNYSRFLENFLKISSNIFKYL